MAEISYTEMPQKTSHMSLESHFFWYSYFSWERKVHLGSKGKNIMNLIGGNKLSFYVLGLFWIFFSKNISADTSKVKI